jgi:hypothetical protein
MRPAPTALNLERGILMVCSIHVKRSEKAPAINVNIYIDTIIEVKSR